ncbi:MAG: DNA repair protein RecN [Myxococcales bacterium]|nr:DNA repair protein RecN [Myxococcales bacterium]
MLTCLRVRNFAIIDELEVDFDGGLNIVTGETGAGKSILIDALELVLGARGKPEIVRTGESSAEVEALFELERVPEGWAPGDDDDPMPGTDRPGDGGELIVRRVVQASGRSRAYLNGRLATGAQLGDVVSGLADISSQHEHQALTDPAQHLRYLDAFGKLDSLAKEAKVIHAQLLAADRALVEFQSKLGDRAQREDLLRFQLQEIDEVDPKLGEDTELSEERDRLRHAEKLVRAAAGAEDALYARDDSLSTTLARHIQELDPAAAIDSTLTPMVDQLRQAQALLEDAARELGSYAQDVNLDPDRLMEVDDRMDAIQRLKRKHGGSIDRVLQFRQAAREELGELDDHEQRLDVLHRERTRAWDEARKVAVALSQARKRHAKDLGRAIGAELTSLGMGDAEIHVTVEQLEGREGELEVDGARFTPRGIDRVEFLISPNRGEEAKPLRKIASGGELSRSMLAIKRVLAGLRPTGLYVFDEVDAGVGGAVAEVIGQKLREVASHHQVLCITHLPQIAVFADAHFRVEKIVEGGRTRSTIRRLSKKEREEEIARMLGGVKITKKTRAAAAEMLRTAHP